MQIPTTNVVGSERLTLIAMAPLVPLYPQNRELIVAMTRAGYSVTQMERYVITDSLRLDSEPRMATRAWQAAYYESGIPPHLPEAALHLSIELRKAIRTVWDAHPFDQQELIIYGATRRGYNGDALAIEVTYRAPLQIPANATHFPATARPQY